MSVKERVLALRLLEKLKKKPELSKYVGVEVKMREKGKQNFGMGGN